MLQNNFVYFGEYTYICGRFYLRQLTAMSETTSDKDCIFERFYADNFPKVKNFALLLTKSEADAEDIAQSIFMKLWIRPDLWENAESMAGYLYVVTRNEIFALFKHQKIERDYEEQMYRSHIVDELWDESPSSPLDDIYYKEKLMLVEMALRRMPSQRRRVFEMSRFEGISSKEIAAALGMPLRTVEDHIYKTLLELRKVLMFVILFRLFP